MSRPLIAALITGAVIFSAVKPVLSHSSANLKYSCHKQNSIYSADLTVPLMLMMGNETMGLNKAYKEYCDLLCTIPMSEKSYASSFNVSCAASILMYEITRQRGIK